ncbi:hypothetical protein EXIGLDRAFT_693223 [Exidia glandulosa HHB12029]|uniref:Uncharacterized protein n=1 Tax=Exidia glandulosa HHB12029 TaxID=1314781 RepID=A0A165HFN5_EXIGL|nr:hypothetical protein EXIGLDRAFT_693223 [Exidia glandulosa HHB12029]
MSAPVESPRSRIARRLARGPTPPSSPLAGLRRRASQSPDSLRMSSPPPDPDTSADPATATPATNTRGRPLAFNPVAFAKTVAINKKRKEEHKNEVVSYAQASTSSFPSTQARAEEREILMFDALVDIRYMLQKESVDQQQQKWSMDAELADAISEYTCAVLCAPIIPAYMLNVNIIMQLMVKNNVYPETWSLLPSRLKDIRAAVSREATQRRYTIKTKIGESMQDKKECLDALCKRILNATKLRVTAPFRARIAWLRYVYEYNEEKRGKDFWSFVDSELVALRASCNNESNRLAYAMTVYVTEDEERFTDDKDLSYDLVTDNSQLSSLQIAAQDAVAQNTPVARPAL